MDRLTRDYQENFRVYRRYYGNALARLPSEYHHVRGRRHAGRPGALFARSFRAPVLLETCSIAQRFQRQQREFLHCIRDVIGEFDEGEVGSDGEDYVSPMDSWYRSRPMIERDLLRG